MGNSSENKPIVLITGITGLIGTKLAEAFVSQYTVVGLDVKRSEQSAAYVIECDLTDDASVTRGLTSVREQHGSRLASVIHLAAYYDFSGKPSPMYQKLTVEGTRRLLKALGEFQVEQFLFSSSLLVMEPAEEDQAIMESSPTKGSWDYPRSKLEAERVIQEERGNIPAVILRIAGVYDEDCHSIPLAQHISRIYEKRLESYFFPGDADHGQPFVHLDDLVVCFSKGGGTSQQAGPSRALLDRRTRRFELQGAPGSVRRIDSRRGVADDSNPEAGRQSRGLGAGENGR